MCDLARSAIVQKHDLPAESRELTSDTRISKAGRRRQQDKAGPLKILVIDQRRGYADMLCRVLSETPQLTVTGPATDLKDGAKLAADTQPDLILFQLDTLWNQLSLFSDRRQSLPAETRLFVIGDRYSDTQLDTLLRLNVHGLLTSAQPLERIMDALLNANDEGQFPHFSPEVMDRLEYDPQHDIYLVKRRNSFMQLTLRQMDVLIQIARGGTVKEVAKKMYLSERAVESHKYRIMRKLDVQDRVELCLFAVREGVIQA